MAPPITPSPHRFLPSNAWTSDRRRDEGSAAAHTASNADQNLAQDSVASLRVPIKSASIHRSSQFAAKPRFSSTPRVQPVQALYSSSPSIKRDRVEDFDGSVADHSSSYSQSPELSRSGLRKGYEQIEDAFNERENDRFDASDGHDANQIMDGNVPTAKRRKIPLPPPWPSHVQTTETSSTAEPSPAHLQDAIDTNIKTPDRLPQRRPIMISSSPRSGEEPPPPISPDQFSPVSPSTLSARRNTPRFDFSGTLNSMSRILNASNGLQRITAASQFVLPPMPGEDDNEESTNLANANLALLFSPQKHRRYQYAPGGLAATVRDWVLAMAVSTSGESVQSAFRVLNIKPGQRNSQLVFGVDTSSEEQNYVLFGSAQGSPEMQLKVGDWVAVMDPSWCIELDGDIWRIGIRWKLKLDDIV